MDSNHRPRAYQARALTCWAMSLCGVSSHLSANSESENCLITHYSLFIFHHSLFITSQRLVWWRWWDSNPWPPACRAGALPAELHPHIKCIMQNAKCKMVCSFLHLFSRAKEAFASFLDVSTELSSRTVARKVFSPLQSLTSVFGMGTGGPSAFIVLTLFSRILDPWKLNNNRFP